MTYTCWEILWMFHAPRRYFISFFFGWDGGKKENHRRFVIKNKIKKKKYMWRKMEKEIVRQRRNENEMDKECWKWNEISSRCIDRETQRTHLRRQSANSKISDIIQPQIMLLKAHVWYWTVASTNIHTLRHLVAQIDDRLLAGRERHESFNGNSDWKLHVCKCDIKSYTHPAIVAGSSSARHWVSVNIKWYSTIISAKATWPNSANIFYGFLQSADAI